MATGKITDKTFEDLAKALRCWLDFQLHCGRAALLSESYLTQPLGEFLLSHYSGYLYREMNHPRFKTDQRGRPKQIDFVLKSRDHQALDFGVECKWTGDSKLSTQGIVDDVMRLECLRRPEGQAGACSRFFILAGRKKTLNNFLAARINNTGVKPPPKFIGGYLPTTVSGKLTKIPVHACKEFYRKAFKDFAEGYKTDLPRSYQARLVADQSGDDVRVLVWKIASSKNRTEFSPEDEWK